MCFYRGLNPNLNINIFVVVADYIAFVPGQIGSAESGDTST